MFALYPQGSRPLPPLSLPPKAPAVSPVGQAQRRLFLGASTMTGLEWGGGTDINATKAVLASGASASGGFPQEGKASASNLDAPVLVLGGQVANPSGGLSTKESPPPVTLVPPLRGPPRAGDFPEKGRFPSEI